MVARPCLEPGCMNLGQNAPRCAAHTAVKVRQKAHARAHAPGDGAARRVRARLTARSSIPVQCVHCRAHFMAHQIEVDHRVPLWNGGLDLEQNLQLLCVGCHATKTRGEASARSRR